MVRLSESFRTRRVWLMTLMAGCLGCRAIAAEPVVVGPVSLVVPFPPGGGTDSLARLVAPALQALWGVPVMVENKPGAGTTLATSAVARATPDGRTMVLASFAHAVAPALIRPLPYDPLRAFSPVAMLATGPNLLLVHPDRPFSNVAQLVAHARSHPRKLSFASFGNGTSAHLAGEKFALDAGIDMLHIPYKGSAPALADLMAGRVDLMFDGLPSLKHARTGRLRALAVTSAERYPGAADIPTVAESGIEGLKGFTTMAWFALLAPTGTPKSWLDRANADVRQVLRQADVRAAIENLGFTAADDSAAALQTFIEREFRDWGQLVRQRGIRAD